MPPTEQTPPAPPVEAPEPIATPAPSTPPAGAPPITPTSPTPPAASPALRPTKQIMIIGAIVAALLIGGGTYAYTKFRPSSTPKNTETKTTNDNDSSDPSPSVDTSDYRTKPTITIAGITLNTNGYLEASAYPSKAFSNNAHNTGGDDSLREYQDMIAANNVAEGFLTALGAHNWQAAYAFLAPGANPYAARSNQWAHEYLETFTLASVLSTSDTPDSGIIVLEPCGKNFGEGWSKTIGVGAYKTPFFYPNKAKGISTQIVVALAKQNGTWKVSGENNNRHDPSAIVSGDPYGIVQAQRAFVNPFDCD